MLERTDRFAYACLPWLGNEHRGSSGIGSQGLHLRTLLLGLSAGTFFTKAPDRGTNCSHTSGWTGPLPKTCPPKGGRHFGPRCPLNVQLLRRFHLCKLRLLRVLREFWMNRLDYRRRICECCGMFSKPVVSIFRLLYVCRRRRAQAACL